MRQIKITLLYVFILTSICSFAAETYHGVTLFEFDNSCMEEYEFKVDKDFVIDDNHYAYHINLDAERTLVLKVFKNTEGQSNVETNLTTVHTCTSVKGIQPQFVVGVNNNHSKVFIKKDGLFYQVAFAEYNIDNQTFFSSFAPPHHSLVYEYHHPYDPMETLRPAALESLDYETRNFYHSTESEKESYSFVYLQIYRDVCVNRPFGVVSPLSEPGKENNYKYENPSSQKHQKQIYRTCQHPVTVTHVKGLGITERFYIEDEKEYKSELVTIDGIDLDTYLKTHTFDNTENIAKSADFSEDITWQLDLTKTAETSKYQPEYIVGKLTNEIEEIEEESLPISKIPETPTIEDDGLKHTVQAGETLYSISKKYKVSVLDIKAENQLSENTIEIGQKLVIDKK